MFSNAKILDDYLKSRHVDPALKENKSSVEYTCLTCKIVTNIKRLAQSERIWHSNYVPKSARIVSRVGSIFPKDSYLAKWHMLNRDSHDWYLTNPKLKPMSRICLIPIE